jgi:hypothetical protein
MCERFESDLREHGLSLAAGVLIAHKSTPIHFSRSVVEGLLRNAKKLSKRSEPPRSAIDFQVITADTAITGEIEEFRNRAYRSSFEWEVLTTRPLELRQLREMIAAVRSLRTARFPRTQLYALREALVRGPKPRATNFYSYQRARNEAIEPLHKFLLDGLDAAGGDDRDLPFWMKREGGQSIEMKSPLVDMVEIYDFVRDEEQQ